MKTNKVIFFGVFLSIILIFSLYIYFNHIKTQNVGLDEFKIRNFEVKGSYYFNYGTQREPLDIMQIFYREFDIYKSNLYRDSLIRFWKILYNPQKEYHQYEVKVFEFGKLNFKYQAFCYNIYLSEVSPFYFIDNKGARSLSEHADVQSFMNDLLAADALNILNKKFKEKEIESNNPKITAFYIETLEGDRYSRLRLPEYLDFSDSTAEGNRIIKWLYQRTKKDFDYDLFTGEGYDN